MVDEYKVNLEKEIKNDKVKDIFGKSRDFFEEVSS